jgi:hypothetical protein
MASLMAFICRFLPYSIWRPLGRLDADRHIDAVLSHNGEGGAFQWVQIPHGKRIGSNELFERG